jgi:Domain of unknown function (DUF5664)
MTELIRRASDPDAPKDPDLPQSLLEHRFDLLDSAALFEMTHILYKGAIKYGVDNWRQIPVEDHLNHLVSHVFAFLSGDRTDHHLAHAMCRAMFAQGVELGKQSPKNTPISEPEQHDKLAEETTVPQAPYGSSPLLDDLGKLPPFDEPIESTLLVQWCPQCNQQLIGKPPMCPEHGTP